MTGRRHFGSVRRRSSGRWQATYWHEGCLHSAGTFPTKADALAYLSTMETDVRRGAWLDPHAGQVTLKVFGNEWLERRPDLAVRTRELYRYLLDRHIFPTLGHATLAGLAPSKIRGWHAELSTRHASTASKSYRLLSTIMRTAVTDGLILVSPCKVDGAGVERPVERPIATLGEIEALAEAMPEHLSLIVLLAAWCQLRRGELLGLRRQDVDLLHATVQIEQSRTFTMDGTSLVKTPKTLASKRMLAIPRHLITVIQEHLAKFTGPSPTSLVFNGKTGIPLTRNVLQVSWQRARVKVGRPDLHFHDLRHTGLTLAAATGATTAELMHRAGHSSTSAALRYQHATKDRDRVLADALGALVSPAPVISMNRDLRAQE
jgi:integrase